MLLNFEFWYLNFYQILEFWEKPTFPDFCKNELILLGWILKPSSMLGATPQGLFVSRKYTFLEFWDMPDLHQAVLLQFFVVLDPDEAFGHKRNDYKISIGHSL